MGDKKLLPKQKILVNGAMTGTSTIVSSTMNLDNLDNVGMMLNWTGTPTGTLSVMVSTDNITFTVLTFNPAITGPSGSAGTLLISLNQAPFSYCYLQYTNTSGTGTLNVVAEAKDVN